MRYQNVLYGILTYCDGRIKTMRIATWNVNSIRARLDHVKRWLDQNRPDVLMLQEIKSEHFPAEEFPALGYNSAAVLQKTYNGVATLSLHPIETASEKLPGDGEDSHARYLETKIGDIRFINIYLPNGNPVDSEKYPYKLAWMARLKSRPRVKARSYRKAATAASPTTRKPKPF